MGVSGIVAGEITWLYDLVLTMPKFDKPEKLTLSVSLSGGDTDAENEWELYVFPKAAKRPSVKAMRQNKLMVIDDIDAKSLMNALSAGKNVVLFGTGPFTALETTFQISLAGRTNGHLATVIADHPLMEDFPNDGFCSWQFRKMMDDSNAAVLDLKRIKHDPIIDIASTYKNAHREAMLFEYSVGAGKLLVCTLNLREEDPGAVWLREHIIEYAMSDKFMPKDRISFAELGELLSIAELDMGSNTNEAMNVNDITMKVK